MDRILRWIMKRVILTHLKAKVQHSLFIRYPVFLRENFHRLRDRDITYEQTGVTTIFNTVSSARVVDEHEILADPIDSQTIICALVERQIAALWHRMLIDHGRDDDC